MELKELRKKTTKELQEHVIALDKDIEKTMNDLIKGKEKNVKKVRAIRKEIAQTLTLLKEQANA